MHSVLLRRARHAVLGTLLIAAGGCSLAGGTDGATTLADRQSSSASSSGNDAVAPSTLPTSVLRPAIPVAVGPPAADPLSAVQTFAEAETAGDAQVAWSMLSAGDRRRYPTPAMWQTEHRQLPQLTSVTITGDPRPVDTGTASQAVDLPAEVSFVPALDLTKGLVPANATATWRVVREDGGWRVSYQDSRFVAKHPAAAGAVTAAAEWAAARQACRTTAADGTRLEVVGGVLGVAGLAARLCGATGTIRPSTAEAVEATDAAAVIAAFGPSATEWTRVVELDGPAPQRVVMGPLGDRWIAVAVLGAE